MYSLRMPWITGHLTGGLGNRLFQHSAAAGLAEKWGHTLIFYEPECTPTNHGPFENIFKLFPETPVVLSSGESLERIPELRNGCFCYTPFPDFPPNPNMNYSVDGWRQTELYFPTKGIHPTWTSLISPERQDELLQKYSGEWFIHIRLGDYKLLPHHQINIASYYQKAFKHIPADSKVLVFSDEATEYKAFLQTLCASLGKNVTIVENNDEIETLFLMSRCTTGAIVANSTFSWWGAYFAHQKVAGFKAYYPDTWGAGLPFAQDVVPSWGEKIHV